MKKISLLMCLVLLLSGCTAAAPVWETVDDVLPAEPVASWLDEAYTIAIAVPDGAELLASTDGCRLYGTASGDYEVETSVFLASSLNSAVRRLSGYDADHLLIVETTRFSKPEYHFAWYAETEEGGRLSQADLVMDGSNCYAVVCSSLETAGNAYDDDSRQVFSSFGLYFDEGV